MYNPNTDYSFSPGFTNEARINQISIRLEALQPRISDYLKSLYSQRLSFKSEYQPQIDKINIQISQLQRRGSDTLANLCEKVEQNEEQLQYLGEIKNLYAQAKDLEHQVHIGLPEKLVESRLNDQLDQVNTSVDYIVEELQVLQKRINSTKIDLQETVNEHIQELKEEINQVYSKSRVQDSGEDSIFTSMLNSTCLYKQLG